MSAKTMLLIALLVVSLSTGVLAEIEKAKQNPQESWMGVYYDKTKIGYLHTTISKDKHEGKDVFKREETITLIGNFSGSIQRANIMRTLTVNMNYEPIHEIININAYNSANEIIRSNMVEINYGEKEVSLKIKDFNMAASYDKDEKPQLRMACQYDFGAMNLSVNNKYHMSHLYCWTIRVRNTEFEIGLPRTLTILSVIRNEKLQINGCDFNTLMVSEVSKDGATKEQPEVHRWHLDTGELLKMEVPADHITFIKETKEKAMSIPVFAGPDLSKLAK